jgi:ubiquinone/menaquinone biosynthesis C-methylase UbiE
MEDHSYNQIAKDYHSKRRKPWRPLEFFISYLEQKKYNFSGISLDLGCANGRNFKILGTTPKKLVGIDLSLEFLKIAQKDLNTPSFYSKFEAQLIQLLLADIRYLPIRKNSINNIFSIATIHHIKNKSERKDVIAQIESIMKIKGNFIVTVWRKWQNKYRSHFLLDRLKRTFNTSYRKQQIIDGLEEYGDKIVPWTLSYEKKTYNRFYHLFSKQEIKRLLKNFVLKEFKIMGGASNNDNFFVFVQKR